MHYRLNLTVDYIIKIIKDAPSPPPSPGLSAVSSLDFILDFTVYPEMKDQVYFEQNNYVSENKYSHNENQLEPTEIELFWKILEDERYDLEKSSYLKNTALVHYAEPDFQIELYDKAKIQTQSKVVYDEVSYVLYDIYETARQKKVYNDNIDETNVLAAHFDFSEESSTLRSVNDIPWEYDTVPLFLYRIIRNVSDNYPVNIKLLTEDDEESEDNTDFETQTPTSDDKENYEKSTDAYSVNDAKFTKSKRQKQKILDKITLLNTYNNICTEEISYDVPSPSPVILKYGNDIHITSTRLTNEHIFTCHMEMVRLLVFSMLCTKFPDVDVVSQLKYRFHVDKLHQLVPGRVIYPDILLRLLNILVLDHIALEENNLYLGQTKWRRQGLMRYTDFLKSSSCPNLDNSQAESEFKSELFPNKSDVEVDYDSKLDLFECPEIAYLIDDYDALVFPEGPSALFKYLNDYIYTEPMVMDVLFQALLKAYFKFDNTDFEYYAPSDNILVRFRDPKKICEVDMFCERLLSKVCVRDFFDYVLDEEQNWLHVQEEEHASETQKLKNFMQQTSENLQLNDSLSCCSKDLLVPGSIKEKLELEKQGIKEHLFYESKYSDYEVQNTINTLITNKNKGKIFDQKNGNTSIYNITNNGEYLGKVINDSEDKKNRFLGYNLGDTRTQVNGKFTTFYGCKCKIRVKFLEWIYHGKLLSLETTMKGNSLYYHYPLSKQNEELAKSYHVITRNNIIIAFSNGNIDGASADNSERTHNIFTYRNVDDYIDNEYSYKESDNYEYDSKYPLDINMSCYWPSGLKIETVDQNVGPFVLKQTLPQQEFSETQSQSQTTASCTTPNTSPYTSIYMEKLRPKTKPEFLIKSRKEHHRVFTRNGDAMVFNEDGSLLIHTAFGEQYWVSPEDVRLCSNKDSIYYKQFHDFIYVSAKGKQVKVTSECETYGDEMLFRIAHDYMRSEIFMRREDGTNMFLDCNKLVVSYDDGTRIISSCFVDDNYVYVGGEDGEISTINYDFNSCSDTSFRTGSETEDFLEPWSTVSMIFRMDHPDYATISYDEDFSATILMPGSVKMNIETNGNSTLEMERTLLTATSQKVTMRSSICPECNCASTSSFFPKSDHSCDIPRYILKAKDCYGKKFYVTTDGKCLWDKNATAEDIDRIESAKPCCKRVPPKDLEVFFMIGRTYEGNYIISITILNKFLKVENNHFI